MHGRYLHGFLEEKRKGKGRKIISHRFHPPLFSTPRSFVIFLHSLSLSLCLFVSSLLDISGNNGHDGTRREREEGVIQNAKWILARRHGRFGAKILWAERWNVGKNMHLFSSFFFFVDDSDWNLFPSFFFSDKNRSVFIRFWNVLLITREEESNCDSFSFVER